MNSFKKLAYACSDVIPYTLIDQFYNKESLFPYHHVISNQYLSHIKGLYNYKNEKQFISDIEFLLKYRKPIHPDELVRYVVEYKTLPPGRFLLTFDDGFREVEDIVAPILSKYGIPAIFFINPAFIDNKQFFYRCTLSLVLEKIKKDFNAETKKLLSDYFSREFQNYDDVRKEILLIHYPQKDKAGELAAIMGINIEEYVLQHQPFLSKESVKTLSSQGFTIGAHSMDHPNYATISIDDQISQTIKSLQFVKDLTNQKYNYFSFPHLDKEISQEFFNAIFKQQSCRPDLLFGVQNQVNEINNRTIHRYNGENPEQSLEKFTKLVSLNNLLRQTFRSNFIDRKGLIK